MKRKSLLLMLLLALLAPWTAKADNLIVADGTGTNTNIPIEGLYADDNYQHTQTIYPSNVLSQMVGGSITKITYYLQDALETAWGATFQVRLGTTDQTSFSTGTVNFISMTGSAHYSGVIVNTNSSKLIEITLSTPYTYSGGNLVVDVRLTSMGDDYEEPSFLGESGSTCYSVHKKDGSSQPPYAQGTAYTFMPKTMFTYSVASACTPTWTSTASQYIANFKAKVSGASSYAINNTTSGTANSYSDYFNSYSITASAGSTIEYNTNGNVSSTWRYGFWVDWNRDGDFADTNEEIFRSDSYISLPTSSDKSFTIPASTAPGNYRMRVIIDYYGSGSTLLPCGANRQGECEDYKLIVTAAVPSNLTASNITSNSAQISWNGNSSSYTLWYSPTNGETLLSQGFEGGSLPSGWTTASDDDYNWYVGDDGGSMSPHTGDYHAGTQGGNNTENGMWLISPTMSLNGASSATLHFWYSNKAWGSDVDEFGVYYRVGTSGSWNQLFYTTSSTSDWTEKTINLTGMANNYQIGFYRKDKWGYGAAIDDVTVTAVIPHTVTTSTSPYTITGLKPNTTYTVKVKGNDTDYCTPITFTTSRCTLTLASSPAAGGTVTASAAGPFDEGDVVTITATPAEGYIFSSWSKSGTGATLSHTYTNPVALTMGTSDATVTANFVAGTVFEVGSSQSTSNVLPSNVYYNYSLTQQIYDPEEIGHTGTIKCISFYYASSTSFTRNIDVYLSMIGPANFDDVEFSKNVGTKVFSGPVTFTQGWNTITFSSTFAYNDINRNLMVTVYDHSGNYVGDSGLQFATFNTNKYCSLSVSNDDDPYDVANPPSPSDVTTAKNYIKFGMTTSTIKNCYNVTAVADPTAAGHVKHSYIGTGTSGTNVVPFCSNYQWSFVEQIYHANAIGGAGTIDTIWFYLNSSNSSAHTNDIVLYMKNVSRGGFKDNTDYETVTASDIVFSGSWTIPASTTGWVPIVLTTPFTYDGTSNLMVAIDENTASYSSRSFRYTSTTNSVFYFRSDNDNYNVDPYNLDSYAGSKSTSSNLANIKLGITYTNSGMSRMYANGTSCTLTAETNAHSGDGRYEFVNWTENNSQASADSLYTFTVNAAHNLTANFIECIAPTGLAVTSNSITSTGATVTWTGNDASYTVQYASGLSESFDNNGTSLPEGWTSVSSVGSGSWTISNSEGSHSSPYSARCAHSNRLDETFLITPMMDLSGASSATLTFWMKNRNWGTNDIEECHVYYRVNGGSWTELWSTTAENNPFAEKTVTLTGLAANYQIGFKCVDHYGYGLCIDDVTITTGDWTTASSSATSPYTFTGLTPGTAYMARVLNACEDASNIVNFVTLNTHTLTASVNPANCGTISANGTTISGATTYNHGTSVTLTATPNTGYDFIGWTVDGSSVGITNPTTVTMDQDHSVVANFELQRFTISASANPSAGGSVVGAGTYNYNASCTLTATANSGYVFENWTENGSVVSTSANYTFTVTAARTLVANFRLNEFQITVSANPSAGGTVSGGGTYTSGTSCTVSTTVNSGYTFDGWYESNSRVSTSTSYTFTVTAARTLEARFTQDTYIVSVSANPSTCGTVSGGGTFTYGDNCTLVATPNAATSNTTYNFTGWYEDDALVQGAGATYTFNVTAARTLEARFTASITKEITGHGGNDGHWYLITSPLNDPVAPSSVTNMVASTVADYDLFSFMQNPSDDLEWRNFKQGAFTELVAGTGYLYASRNTVTLSFTGIPYQGNGDVPLTHIAGFSKSGWNLVGNPYNEVAYTDIRFYVMNPEGTEIIAAANNVYSVQPMEGIFIYRSLEDGDGWVSFSRASDMKSASLSLNVMQDRGLVDRAIIDFSNDKTLPKFQLNESHTKIYIPQDDKDYAVVYAESNIGEMPVNFKAEKNGTYTIGVNAEEVSFGYLHLIDNKTGADVDLLAMPSYTFDALTTDYASRFKLVFATGNATDDSFAFYSNGGFVISNDGDATLQVMDVTGRILKSETVHGCASVSVNAAPGVYMLRLVNGESERVQKVVVR